MKLKPIHLTHAEAQILDRAILIIERVANTAEENAAAVEPTHPAPVSMFDEDAYSHPSYREDDTADEIREMNLEIRDTADRASTAIDYLYEAIKSYDRAGYNDNAE